jgi:hypothetical protein
MEIEAILKNAKVIDEDEISKTKVTLGSVVKLRDEETVRNWNSRWSAPRRGHLQQQDLERLAGWRGDSR